MTKKRTRRFIAFTLAPALTVLFTAQTPSVAAISRSQEIKARAFNRLSEGIEAYRKGNAKDAIELLKQVTNVALNSFRAFYYLGISYKSDRQYTKAIEALSFALELDPTNLQAHVELGDSYLKRGDTEEALAEYHRALAVQPGYAPAHDGLGRAAESTGDDDRAVESFRKAIELNPGFPDASLNLGDLYLRKDRLKEAVELFLKAISVRPDFAAAHNRLGVAYARQKLANEAIAALRKAAELEKGNPWHPFTIGQIEMELGNLSQAQRDFDAALLLDRNYVEAYISKARLYRRFGDFDAAVRLLDEAVERPSEDQNLLKQARELRAQFEEEGKRSKEWTLKIGAGEATESDRRGLAALRAGMGDFSGAAEIFAVVAGENPSADPNAPAEVPPGAVAAAEAASAADLFTLGYYRQRAGDFAGAGLAFERLRVDHSKSLPVLVNLGLSLLGQGRNEEAAVVFEEALSIDPAAIQALVGLGNARVLQGEWTLAGQAFDRALSAAADFDGRARVETILKALRWRGAGASGGAGKIAGGERQ